MLAQKFFLYHLKVSCFSEDPMLFFFFKISTYTWDRGVAVRTGFRRNWIEI